MLDPTQNPMGAQLRRLMRAAGVTRAQLALQLGVTPQAIYEWLKTGKIARERLPALAKVLRVSVGELMGDEPRIVQRKQRNQSSRTPASELGELSQAEIDLVNAHRQVPSFVHDQIEGVIRGYLDHVAKDVAAFMGPRDLELQRSIEPKLITEQIKAQSKDLLKATPPRKPKKPTGKRKRGREGNHSD